MIRAFSVIVPVLNLETLIVRTLQSIEDSIAFFYAHYDGADPVEAEVLVVNEGSSDRTLAVVTEFAQNKPHYKIVNHHKSLGGGPARNTGAKVSKGDILLFCDGDDLFYKEHIYLNYQVLNHQPNGTPVAMSLGSDRGTYAFNLPPHPVGVVRTGVYMQDTLHPHWKAAIENTIPLNLCVRRECHEFIEGFPEAPVYKKVGCEDVGYDYWLYRFFRLHKVDIETVEYIRYPGNNMDRQLKKFQTAPEDYQEEMSAETQQMHGVRQKLEQEKLAYLLGKFPQFEKSSEFFALLNWQQLANEYFNQQNFVETINLCEAGLKQEPQSLPTVKNLLAIAYNNVGSACHQQRNLPLAADYFQRSLKINPAFAAADLAKVHFNLALVLKDQGAFAPALTSLQKALALDPQFPQAIALVPDLTDRAQTAQRGYQFTQDSLSAHLAVWQQVLAPFVNMPGLQVLDIGSGEGRAACWLMDNLLTHESAHLTCMDTFAAVADSPLGAGNPGDALALNLALNTVEQRFDFNIARTGSATKVKKLVGNARDLLRTLPLNAYDVVYVARSRRAIDVLEDAVLAWGLVKIGGILGFDHYGWKLPEGTSPEAQDGKPPGAAIDAFLSIYGNQVKILHRGYQLFMEKLPVANGDG
jgi:glycosyltransferase involved in cell wall biosynthesis/Tfp pilus assembly protein PilF